MDRMKTFSIYALCVILFFIFSNLMIDIGLNSMYKDMQIKNSVEQVDIEQSQSTLVNGRIKGTIKNSGVEDLNGKFIKIDIYSEREVFLGSKYYEIQNLEKDQTQPFELYFKAQYAKYYDVSIVNEKEEGELFDNIEFLAKDLNKSEILMATLITLILIV